MPKDGDKNSLEPVGGDMRTWKKTSKPKANPKEYIQTQSIGKNHWLNKIFIPGSLWAWLVGLVPFRKVSCWTHDQNTFTSTHASEVTVATGTLPAVLRVTSQKEPPKKKTKAHNETRDASEPHIAMIFEFCKYQVNFVYIIYVYIDVCKVCGRDRFSGQPCQVPIPSAWGNIFDVSGPTGGGVVCWMPIIFSSGNPQCKLKT